MLVFGSSQLLNLQYCAIAREEVDFGIGRAEYIAGIAAFLRSEHT
jgi:hypothetical protein